MMNMHVAAGCSNVSSGQICVFKFPRPYSYKGVDKAGAEQLDLTGT